MLNVGPQQPKSGGPGQIPQAAVNPSAWGPFQSDPLAVLNDLFVPKESIQPGRCCCDVPEKLEVNSAFLPCRDFASSPSYE